MVCLKCGDCLELLKDIPDKSVDCVITDPPYIVANHGGGKGALARRISKMRDSINFISDDFMYSDVFPELVRVCKVPNIIIFCSNSQLGRTIVFFENLGFKTDVLVWSKINPAPLCNGKYVSDLEYIVYVHTKGSFFNNSACFCYKKKTKRYSIIPNGAGKMHPTQKPLELMAELVSVHTKKGDVVLDPFMGSGTTGMASKFLKRDFIGFEIDPDYFVVAKERIEKTPSDLPLFEV